MPFWKIAWRNIEQRALASSLTALSMALGVAVLICVIVIYGVAVRTYTQDAQGYHLIVGGKGGDMQLVMSTVFHQAGLAPATMPGPTMCMLSPCQIGMSHPPRKSVAISAEEVSRFAYSAMKNMLNFIDEYSVW